MRNICRAAGLLALFSMMLWAFAGIPLWASLDGAPGRAYVIAILHIFGLTAGVLSLQDNCWEKQ